MRRWRLGLAGGKGATAAGSPGALHAAAIEVAGGHDILVCADDAGGIAEAALKSGADVIFPTMLPLGTSTQVPRVGYLFDFQHCHMPELFSTRTRRNRDARFARISADVDAIVVYAQATADDAVRFLGISRDRILTLPYAPHALPWWFDVDPAQARRRHGIGAHYIVVCNHFWKHKDHATALRSFALLRAEHPELNLELVLTGDPVDHRDPGHYGRLLSLSKQLKIATKTHFLGLVPKRDQLALLRGSIALVQPTRFEGGPGGGSVYEAVGLGVPCVVSDIPVNLEIDQGNVRFFNTGDALDLAAKLTQIIETRPTATDRESLLATGNVNLARLGNAICDYLVQIPGR